MLHILFKTRIHVRFLYFQQQPSSTFYEDKHIKLLASNFRLLDFPISFRKTGSRKNISLHQLINLMYLPNFFKDEQWLENCFYFLLMGMANVV